MIAVPSHPTLAIVGPTAVGKTSHALALAHRHGAAILSADSRQVYIGMDIGTGKEASQGQWQSGHPWPVLTIQDVDIFGLNLLNPDQEFSVAHWHTIALNILTYLHQQQRPVIIVGGTGFYLKALQGHLHTTTIPPQPALRHQLASLSLSQLQAKAYAVQPGQVARLNHSDWHNPVRLIRLIEIAQTATHPTTSTVPPPPPLQLHLLGLTLDRTLLYRQADQRVETMINQGLVAEVQQLLRRYPANPTAFKSIGYAEIIQHLQGQLSLEQAIAQIKTHTHHYIRRQYTWFNKQSVDWLNIQDDHIADHLDQAFSNTQS